MGYIQVLPEADLNGLPFVRADGDTSSSHLCTPDNGVKDLWDVSIVNPLLLTFDCKFSLTLKVILRKGNTLSDLIFDKKLLA